jgi:hypothetical protein
MGRAELRPDMRTGGVKLASPDLLAQISVTALA